jgi:hypothetical protein
MACLKKRGQVFYAQYYLGPKQIRVGLDTGSYQVAKEKLRQLETSLARDAGPNLPTHTPIAEVVQRYVEHIRTTNTSKSAQTDVYYLREAFGVVCRALAITSHRPSPKTSKRPLLPGAVQDLRRRKSCTKAVTFWPAPSRALNLPPPRARKRNRCPDKGSWPVTVKAPAHVRRRRGQPDMQRTLPVPRTQPWQVHHGRSSSTARTCRNVWVQNPGAAPTVVRRSGATR